ncbi:MAG: RNA polymerase sigma factor [Steroidobacteraceae bacterium]
MNFEDRRLAERLLKGEERAFNEFFNHYFSRLYRFAITRMNDEDAARDIVQQTLCRALRKIDTYRGEAAMFTWLCQICRSQLSDYFEQRGRHVQRFIPIEDDPHIQAALEAMASPDLDPELTARRSEVSRLVQVVLDHLPPRYGDALEWKYVDGLSVDEIAERMNLQHGAAQSLLQRARQAFRDMFEQLYGAQPALQLFQDPI